jgi:uncharacterized membrane protein YkoI
MKNKLIGILIGFGLILGGAFAVGAANGADDTQPDDKGGLKTTTTTKGNTSGNVEFEVETEHGQTFTKVKLDDSSSAPVTPSSSSISVEEAKAIALARVNGSVTKIEKEMEHGRLEYKFEIQSSEGEVDVRVDAETGAITRVKYDNKNQGNRNEARIDDSGHDANDDKGGLSSVDDSGNDATDDKGGSAGIDDSGHDANDDKGGNDDRSDD